MRLLHTSLILALIATTAFAQSKSKQKKNADPEAITVVSGCVSQAADKTHYEVEDAANGSYRLSGTDVHDFIGQKVQLIGGVIETKKLRIKGGLVPNANVAGQAGAIDPTQAANAVAGGQAPTGNVQLPEFRVKSIRPLGSNCGK